MYRRVGTDYLFRDEEGRLYALEIASPAEYELRSDAAKDCTRYRFERRNGEVLLMAYKSSLNLIEDDGAGRKNFKQRPLKHRKNRQLSDIIRFAISDIAKCSWEREEGCTTTIFPVLLF